MSLSPDTALRRFPIAPETKNRDSQQTLTDFTHRSRLGLRGRGTADWCVAQGLPFPAKVNEVARANDLRIARLGGFELLVLPDSKTMPEKLRDLPAGTYDAYREESWAWFQLQGPGLLEDLSSCTSADLTPNQNGTGRVVQTRFAGLDAVLITSTRADGAEADLLFDIASHGYAVNVFADRCPDWQFVLAG